MKKRRISSNQPTLNLQEVLLNLQKIYKEDVELNFLYYYEMQIEVAKDAETKNTYAKKIIDKVKQKELLKNPLMEPKDLLDVHHALSIAYQTLGDQSSAENEVRESLKLYDNLTPEATTNNNETNWPSSPRDSNALPAETSSSAPIPHSTPLPQTPLSNVKIASKYKDGILPPSPLQFIKIDTSKFADFEKELEENKQLKVTDPEKYDKLIGKIQGEINKQLQSKKKRLNKIYDSEPLPPSKSKYQKPEMRVTDTAQLEQLSEQDEPLGEYFLLYQPPLHQLIKASKVLIMKPNPSETLQRINAIQAEEWKLFQNAKTKTVVVKEHLLSSLTTQPMLSFPEEMNVHCKLLGSEADKMIAKAFTAYQAGDYVTAVNQFLVTFVICKKMAEQNPNNKENHEANALFVAHYIAYLLMLVSEKGRLQREAPRLLREKQAYDEKCQEVKKERAKATQREKLENPIPELIERDSLTILFMGDFQYNDPCNQFHLYGREPANQVTPNEFAYAQNISSKIGSGPEGCAAFLSSLEKAENRVTQSKFRLQSYHEHFIKKHQFRPETSGTMQTSSPLDLHIAINARIITSLLGESYALECVNTICALFAKAKEKNKQPVSANTTTTTTTNVTKTLIKSTTIPTTVSRSPATLFPSNENNNNNNNNAPARNKRKLR